MGRELSSFDEFQKTLSQYGYNSGNVLIRLSYKRTDQTLFEAMQRIGELFKQPGDQDSGPSPAQNTDASQEKKDAQSTDTVMGDAAPVPDSQQVLDSTQPTEQTARPEAMAEHASPKETSVADPSTSQDPYQPVNVFLAPAGTTPAAALAPPDDLDYTPTIAHAKLHQSRLQERSRNKRLLSDQELETKAAAEEARIDAVKSVLFKVRFPDNTSSDWQVGPSETGSFLYEAVRHVMANSSLSFHLILPGSGAIIKDDSGPKHNLVRGYKLSGRVLLSLVWDDSVPPAVRKQPFLKSNFAQQGQAVKIPVVPEVSDHGKEVAPPAAQPDQGESSRRDGDGSGKKVPKWFKFGKK